MKELGVSSLCHHFVIKKLADEKKKEKVIIAIN